MSENTALGDPLFPRSSMYDESWVLHHAMGGAHPLWLPEWLCQAVDLRPGMRVLDLGCGNATSSIFFARDFGVQVWGTDLWIKPAENWTRIVENGMTEQVFPIHADARRLPFANEFFDAILCVDSYQYFGTDDVYLPYILSFLKPGGQFAIASAGFMQEFDAGIPSHLQKWWEPDLWCLHTPAWWRHHWERTGCVDIELADAMPDGWRRWLRWYEVKWPDSAVMIETLKSDAGRYLVYVRLVARKRADAKPLPFDFQTGY